MQVKASLKKYRRSARKAREVANVLRGMDVENAVCQLMVLEKGSCQDILSLVKSAVANAVNNFKLKEDDLYIAEIKVNEGATMKRWRARAHGRAFKILKRTCHIELVLDEKEKDLKNSKNIKTEKSQLVEKTEIKKENDKNVKKASSVKKIEKEKDKEDDKKIK